MKIRFETTIDDVIKFNRFYIENSPTLRRQRMIFSLIVPAILLILAILIMFVNVDAIIEDMFRFFVQATALGILGLVFSIGWYFFSRWQWMNNIERNLRKLYAEGDNRAVLGWREMELVGNRLRLKMPLIESNMDLRAVDKIVGDDEFTYVYISSNQAYLIPMNLYPEEEYRQFVTKLREAWENRDSPERTSPQERDERIIELPQ